MRRLRLGEAIAGAGGVALVAVMWAPWYRSTGGTVEVNAWQSFAVTDVLLALAGLAGLVTALLQATRRSPALPVVADVLAVVIAAVALVAVAFRLIDPPGPNSVIVRAWGAFAGFVSCVAVLVGAWLAMRTE